MNDYQEALHRAKQELLGQVAGVLAVGEGRDDAGDAVIDVWVESVLTADISAIPPLVQGVPVRTRESGGSISAQ